MKLNQDRVRQWVNFTAILSAFGTNVLANIFPIKGLTIGEISQTLFRDVLIIPASYAFAIWGLIYLGLISLAIYQVLPVNRENPYLRQMGYFLSFSSFAQIIWIFCFLSQFFLLSLVAMIAILVPLIILYLRLGISQKAMPFKQRWLVNFPISIYLGWISVATIVNVALVLSWEGWKGWGISPVVWTILMMLIGSLITLIIRVKCQDRVYTGVFIWALVAIALQHGDNLSIAGTAGSLAGFLMLLMVIPGGTKSKATTE